MTDIRQVTQIRGANLGLPAGGWAGEDEMMFEADAILLDTLRGLARRSVSDLGCPSEMEHRITLREVPEERLRKAVADVRRQYPTWALAGDPGEPLVNRLDRHYEVPQRRAAGLVTA